MVKGQKLVFAVELVEGFGGLLQGVEVGEVVGIAGNGDERDHGAGFFELGAECEAGFAGGEGEGDEGRWDVEFVEGAGHGVLAADGREAEFVLGVEGT